MLIEIEKVSVLLENDGYAVWSEKDSEASFTECLLAFSLIPNVKVYFDQNITPGQVFLVRMELDHLLFM